MPLLADAGPPVYLVAGLLVILLIGLVAGLGGGSVALALLWITTHPRHAVYLVSSMALLIAAGMSAGMFWLL